VLGFWFPLLVLVLLLEGLRLSLDVTAMELLPVAYVFLKAVLECPAKYGEQFVWDVAKWGRWVTECAPM
jgi:putative DNA methylase